MRKSLRKSYYGMHIPSFFFQFYSFVYIRKIQKNHYFSLCLINLYSIKVTPANSTLFHSSAPNITLAFGRNLIFIKLHILNLIELLHSYVAIFITMNPSGSCILAVTTSIKIKCACMFQEKKGRRSQLRWYLTSFCRTAWEEMSRQTGIKRGRIAG